MFLFEPGSPIAFDAIKLIKDFDLGIDPPPLEEFKRLMESLADTASSMFEEEGFFSAEEEPSLTRYGEPVPTNRAGSPKVKKTPSRTPMNATQVQYSDSIAAMEEEGGDVDDFDGESDLDAFRRFDSPTFEHSIYVKEPKFSNHASYKSY